MPGSLSRAAPIRFLIGVTLAWTTARGIAVIGWAPGGPGRQGVASRGLGSTFRADAAAPPIGRAIGVPLLAGVRSASLDVHRAAPESGGIERASVRLLDQGRPARGAVLPTIAASPGAARPVSYRRATGLAEVLPAAGSIGTTKRWSGSAWAFARGGGRATGLAPGGQIGGGQAGARILYRLDRKGLVSASARLSATLGGARQTEAAVGIDVRPIASLPVHLMAERRIAIDRGGRNAWTLGAAGGAYDVVLMPGWKLDGYAEAGVVGARRRDLYADGALRVARAIGLGDGRSLAVGGGIWGAAQPDAQRLDVGPSIVLRLPVARRTVALALDWRERVAGGAKPGSGVALTLATDF